MPNYNNVAMSEALQAHLQHNIRTGQSNSYRQARATYSPFALFMRNKKTEMSTDPKAIWEFEFQRSTTKLSFLILIYLYTQDDNEIDKKEKRSVNKILRNKGSYLNEADYELIIKFIDDLPDLSYVMNYIGNNNIKDKVFKTSISKVRKLIKKDKRYIDILDDINNKYLINEI